MPKKNEVISSFAVIRAALRAFEDTPDEAFRQINQWEAEYLQKKRNASVQTEITQFFFPVK